MSEKHEPEEWYADVPRSIRLCSIAGFSVLALSVGGFGSWAATAPLSAAVITSGTFVAVGQNKIVQHLEGGIIKSILAKEGDHVKEGQTLILLDNTKAKADSRRLSLRLFRLEAARVRLEATIEGREDVDFSSLPAVEGTAGEVDEILQSQRSVHASTFNQFNASVFVLEKSIEALRQRRGGSASQRDALNRQYELITSELEGKRSLAERGLMARTQVFEVERAAASAQGSLGRIDAELGDLDSQISRFEGQISQLSQDLRQKANEQLQDVNAERDDIRQQLQTARAVLSRIEIKAPVAGTLVKLHYHTPGGVIESGKEILEILPEGEGLVIESNVRPIDIDSVRVGQTASVQLSSFNRRTTPILNGDVTYVSADTLRQPGSMSAARDVYVARISISDQELKRLDGLKITPGMPADVFIETAERTFLQYITKPVQDSMLRAFREQ